MKRLFLVLGTSVLVLPWLSGDKVRAGSIHWDASVSMLGPNTNPDHLGAVILSQNYGSNASIGVFSGDATSGTNSQNVVLSTLATYDIVSAPGGALFGGPSANYSLSLTLRDAASGTSGSLTFSGNLSGEVFQATGIAPITNTFLSPTTQTLDLGGNLYTVTISSFIPPGNVDEPIGSGSVRGSISASISVQPTVMSAPEPSSLLLACLGLPSLGLARCFRRRKIVQNGGRNA